MIAVKVNEISIKNIVDYNNSMLFLWIYYLGGIKRKISNEKKLHQSLFTPQS